MHVAYSSWVSPLIMGTQYRGSLPDDSIQQKLFWDGGVGSSLPFSKDRFRFEILILNPGNALYTHTKFNSEEKVNMKKERNT